MAPSQEMNELCALQAQGSITMLQFLAMSKALAAKNESIQEELPPSSPGGGLLEDDSAPPSIEASIDEEVADGGDDDDGVAE